MRIFQETLISVSNLPISWVRWRLRMVIGFSKVGAMNDLDKSYFVGMMSYKSLIKVGFRKNEKGQSGNTEFLWFFSEALV